MNIKLRSGLASHVSGLVSNGTHNLWGLDLDGTLQGAGGVGGLLAVVRDGDTYIPTYDANGNISEYLSAADGTVAAHYDYSPFGETLVASGPLASAFTHRFSTKPWCPVTGFCEYQMRKYNPNLGRWMSRDPIGEEGTLINLYVSCGNSIVLTFDYLGEDAPNLGGRLVQPEPPDKPEGCGKPCPCVDGKSKGGVLKCKFVKVAALISGGWKNFRNHQKHKKNHATTENRSGLPDCWNPAYCFKSEPICPDGWQPYGNRSFLTDGENKLSNTKPAWNFGTNSLDANCYEMQSREWILNLPAFLGRWCTKCE